MRRPWTDRSRRPRPPRNATRRSGRRPHGDSGETGHGPALPRRADAASGDGARRRSASSTVVAVGLVLRFWTHVRDVARRGADRRHRPACPCARSAVVLRRDGAPPLYYVLLHFWMKRRSATPTTPCRSLSGVCRRVATLPVAWVAGRRIRRSVGGLGRCLGVVASAPVRRLLRHRGPDVLAGDVPRPPAGIVGAQPGPRAAATGQPASLWRVVTAALLYSQYWALYLVGVVGPVARSGSCGGAEPDGGRPARWRLRRGRRRRASSSLPWVPTFLYQSRAHRARRGPARRPTRRSSTRSPGSPTTRRRTRSPGSNQGRLLALVYFALAGLGAVRRRPRPLAHRPRPAHEAAGTRASPSSVVGHARRRDHRRHPEPGSAFSPATPRSSSSRCSSCVALGTLHVCRRPAPGRRRGRRRARRAGGERPERLRPSARRRRQRGGRAGRSRPAGRHRRLLPRPARPVGATD